MRYIDQDFEDALTRKWREGIQRYRDETQKFVGDALDELFQEMLDSLHYVRKLEINGGPIPGFELTLKNMAHFLQDNKNLIRRKDE